MQQRGVNMKKNTRIEEYLEKSGGIISSLYCRENDIPTVYLTRLVKSGKLNKVSKGLYISENADYDELYFFQYQFKKAIFSYETALYLLGKTDRIVTTIEVTVPQKYKFNNKPNAKVYYTKPEFSELGVCEVKTMYGNIVRVYSYERVLCDVIANREKVDSELYVKTIRGYAEYEKKDLNILYQIASKMKIADKVREVMEVVYE